MHSLSSISLVDFPRFSIDFRNSYMKEKEKSKLYCIVNGYAGQSAGHIAKSMVVFCYSPGMVFATVEVVLVQV